VCVCLVCLSGCVASDARPQLVADLDFILTVVFLCNSTFTPT